MDGKAAIIIIIRNNKKTTDWSPFVFFSAGHHDTDSASDRAMRLINSSLIQSHLGLHLEDTFAGSDSRGRACAYIYIPLIMVQPRQAKPADVLALGQNLFDKLTLPLL